MDLINTESLYNAFFRKYSIGTNSASRFKASFLGAFNDALMDLFNDGHINEPSLLTDVSPPVVDNSGTATEFVPILGEVYYKTDTGVYYEAIKSGSLITSYTITEPTGGAVSTFDPNTDSYAEASDLLATIILGILTTHPTYVITEPAGGWLRSFNPSTTTIGQFMDVVATIAYDIENGDQSYVLTGFTSAVRTFDPNTDDLSTSVEVLATVLDDDIIGTNFSVPFSNTVYWSQVANYQSDLEIRYLPQIKIGIAYFLQTEGEWVKGESRDQYAYLNWERAKTVFEEVRISALEDAGTSTYPWGS